MNNDADTPNLRECKYWIQVEPDTYNPTGHTCWSYYPGDTPCPSAGFWIEVKETGKTNQKEVPNE